MMTALVVCTAAILAAALTFFSGFGLGTLLLPAFAAFYPIEVAVAATAVVHLANNLFKLALVGRDVHARTLVRFGPPAVIAAFIGAWLLTTLAFLQPVHEYALAGRACRITIVKLIIAAIIALFASLELSPRFEKWAVPTKWMPLGGALSGFFGGLSGHQGALRSAFLIRAGLTKEQFIATGVATAVMVDFSRLAVYGLSFFSRDRALLNERGSVIVVIAACVAAFAGSIIGARLVKKVTLTGVRRWVGVMLLIMAGAMAAGVI
jgi:uncharacterized membrane protein YfcA